MNFQLNVLIRLFINTVCRVTFEHEKGRNIEQVEQMKATEMNLIALAREVERLRAEALNVEKRAYGTFLFTLFS